MSWRFSHCENQRRVQRRKDFTGRFPCSVRPLNADGVQFLRQENSRHTRKTFEIHVNITIKATHGSTRLAPLAPCGFGDEAFQETCSTGASFGKYPSATMDGE